MVTVILSFISITAFSTTAIILYINRKPLNRYSQVFITLLISVLLYAGISGSNILEHLNITSFFDPFEDMAEIVFIMLFLFFIYRWKKVQTERRFIELFRLAPMPLAEVGKNGNILEVNNLMATILENDYGIAMKSKPTLSSWWEKAFPDSERFNDVMKVWQSTVELAGKTGNAIKMDEREMVSCNGSKKIVILGGSIIGENLLLSLYDITDRKSAESEKENLQKQLLQTQKLEAIGVLAGGVAHDFNNILGAIIGYAEISLEDLPADSATCRNIEKILDAAQRSSRLTRQLLIFARKQASSPKIIDLNESVETMLKMLQRLIGENITLAWLPASGNSCKVKIDPTHLDQILVNLCVNARDAIDNIGQITIKIGTFDFDETTSQVYVDCKPGSYVRLSVADNGCGMNAETLQHVFEPFFTTKGIGKGTGLGLSTVYGIVRQCKGFINVYSECDIGTTFNIYLPLHKDNNEITESDVMETIPLGNNETILLVEDDAMLIEVSQNILRKLGYHVLSATAPEQALEIVEDKSTKIDLVLTDVIMPQMNGRELVDSILEKRPEVKFLFMSGYTADVVLHHGVTDGDTFFISKPFSKKEIAFKIKDVLNKK